MASETVIKVVWGKQLISPRQFNTFEVGPFELTTTVQPGESEEDAFDRAYRFLDEMARSTYKSKISAFEEAYKAAHIVAGGGRR